MQRVTLVRYATKPETTAENERLSRAVFTELKKNAPKGIAYALLRNGNDFVHLFVNTRDADASPVVELESFKTYQKDAQSRFTAAPDALRLELELVDSYGLPLA